MLRQRFGLWTSALLYDDIHKYVLDKKSNTDTLSSDFVINDMSVGTPQTLVFF